MLSKSKNANADFSTGIRLLMEKLLLKWALKNSVDYSGKPNLSSVLNKVLGEQPGLRKDMKALALEAKRVCALVEKMPLGEQEKKLLELWPEALEEKPREEKQRVLPDLPGAERGKVMMRLAPFPSGPLHVGNVVPFILNDEYSKRYDGKLLLIFDDTVGSAEKRVLPAAYDLIKEGLDWLGIKYDKHNVVFKSDRLEIYYKYALELIKKNGAYVCKCSQKVLGENREKGRACEHRTQTPEFNAGEWKKMLAGEYKQGQAVLRLKTDINHANPAFRDRVL